MKTKLLVLLLLVGTSLFAGPRVFVGTGVGGFGYGPAYYVGAGFLEKVYQRALVIELKSAERLCRMEANRPRVSAPEPIEAPPLAG